MSKIYFKRDPNAFRELMRSSEMQTILGEYAGMIQGRAGIGYTTKVMPTRAVVFPDTSEAEQDNYNNNTLLKARGGGR